MPGAAEFFMILTIKEVLEGSAAKRYKITAIEVMVTNTDERKVPWLWEVTANIAITLKPKKAGFIGTHIAWTWVGLFQFTPDATSEECWRSITDTETGPTIRTHPGKSEWTREFRSTVAREWLREFQEHQRYVKDSDMTPQDRRELLQNRKTDVANRLRVSPEELKEILEATE